jgi:hypothetical protein
MNAATQIVRTLQKGDVQTFKFKEYVRWDNRTGQKILGIRGVHPAARKVVFVAQTATVQPRHGDILLCKVIKDTAPADPKRGALIVAPVVGENKANCQLKEQRVQVRLHFDISEAKVAKGEPIVLVAVKTRCGAKVTARSDFEIRAKSDLPADWPLWVNQKIEDHLNLIAVSRANWLKKKSEVCDWFEVKNLSNLDTGELLIRVVHKKRVGFDESTNLEVISIRSRGDIPLGWTEQTKKNVLDAIEKTETAYAQAKKVEWSVVWSGTAPDRFPRVIGREKRSGKVTASFVITSPDQLNDGLLASVKSIAQAMLTRAEAINAEARAKLERRRLIDELKHDADGKTRFQWAGDYMTDGRLWFPRRRPEGLEWRKFPIAAVPAGYWETFLQGLEGKIMEELLDYCTQESWRRPLAERVKLTERQEEIKRTIKSEIERMVKEKQMWQGGGVDAIAVGKCVVFIVERNGQCLYVVDNPGPGAIYVFRSKEGAHRLAREEVTRQALIKSGAIRILHMPGWQLKLAETIAST